MHTFSSVREAKEYLIARIVSEAELEGVPLSETERKMMYFSATAWTIPDILEVNAVFERDYDQAAYELKIGKLAKKARSRRVSKTDQETWKAAIRILEREDHYLLVPLSASTESTASLLADRLKLVGTALLISILLLVSIFLIYGKG